MIGCLFGMFVYPFKFLRWCFTNGLKGLIVLAVTIIGLLIMILVFRHSINDSMTPKPPVVAVQDITAPTIKAAPYLVETWSRRYYAVKAVKNKDGTVTMTDYYEYLNTKWTYIPGEGVLDKSFGNVEIKRR